MEGRRDEEMDEWMEGWREEEGGRERESLRALSSLPSTPAAVDGLLTKDGTPHCIISLTGGNDEMITDTLVTRISACLLQGIYQRVHICNYEQDQQSGRMKRGKGNKVRKEETSQRVRKEKK